MFWAYTRVMARDGHDARFRSQANYKLHVGPGREWPVEAVLKVVGAVVGMSMELWTGGSYQALVCENHTAHPGWFHGDNINNWCVCGCGCGGGEAEGEGNVRILLSSGTFCCPGERGG